MEENKEQYAKNVKPKIVISMEEGICKPYEEAETIERRKVCLNEGQ